MAMHIESSANKVCQALALDKVIGCQARASRPKVNQLFHAPSHTRQQQLPFPATLDKVIFTRIADTQ